MSFIIRAEVEAGDLNGGPAEGQDCCSLMTVMTDEYQGDAVGTMFMCEFA